MADNRTLQSTAATIASGAIAALYEVTFSGDAGALIAPTVLGTISGAEGARTFVEISSTNPLPIALRDGAGNAITSAARGSERAVTVQIVDNAGNQVTAFSGSGGTASNYGSSVPSAGTAAGFSDGTNMQLGRVFDLDSGAGTQYGLGINLRKIASGGSVEAGTSSDPLRVDPTGTTSQPITGAKTNNNAAPGATNVGVLPALANALVPTWTEGNQVALSVDLTGRQRVQPSGGISTGAVTTVAASATSVSILASNTARKGYIIHNDTTTDGIILYLKLGATASATSYSYRLLPGENVEVQGPCYTGAIDGIWSSATGNARITELS